MAPNRFIRGGAVRAHHKARFIARLAAVYFGGVAIYLGFVLLALRLLGIET